MAKRRKTIYAGDVVYDVIYTMPPPRIGDIQRKAIRQISAEAIAKWNCKSATRKLEMRMAAGFHLHDLVITLTYREADYPESYTQAQRRLQTMLRQLRRHRQARKQDLWYIYVTEGRHGDHRMHHHVIVNAVGGDLEIIRSLWRWGEQVDLSYVADKGYEGWAVYLSKERREASLNGKKMFVASKNCPKPVTEYQITDDGATIEAPPGAVDVVDSCNRNLFASYRYLKYRLPGKVHKPFSFSGSKLSLTSEHEQRKRRKRLPKSSEPITIDLQEHIMIKNNWYYCPACRKKLFPVGAQTVVQRLTLKCKGCAKLIEVNIPEPGATAPQGREPRAD